MEFSAGRRRHGNCAAQVSWWSTPNVACQAAVLLKLHRSKGIRGRVRIQALTHPQAINVLMCAKNLTISAHAKRPRSHLFEDKRL